MSVALIAAIVIALAFAALGRWRHARPAWIAAAMWVVYAGYETMMVLRVWCTGECNLRVDLLLFYPVMLWVSVSAVAKTLRRRP